MGQIIVSFVISIFFALNLEENRGLFCREESTESSITQETR